MGNYKELIWLEHRPGRVERGKKFLLERKAVAKSQKAIHAQPSSLDCNQEVSFYSWFLKPISPSTHGTMRQIPL